MTDLLRAGDARFVSLRTYRRDGTGVDTPVWVVRDGDALAFTTPDGSGKVKRLRRDPRVTVVPCSRRGAVEPGAQPSAGRAAFVDDPAEAERLTGRFRARYGLEYRVFLLVERLARRGRNSDRVLLRVVPA
ncbi:PPOX class F420-dependent oxidoreductase [Angustibacter aerolatus]|uniref:Pyridoxamine 5'-phosphate oxidase N-terminal domain-containing protein n=1 Tax=Angustibacter aerolatus TaxID=1162965 RepID=A0ABQ6JKI2_9ACTN|nr:PPOX class F420-dependent oxidoreductase [Angustibacter aerolatus]GMA87362.1 hypothetical protein GCM10025868_26120 [Angustibacter aerolatus]